MPSNWGYVLAAYGIAAVTLLSYWSHLARRTRALGRPLEIGPALEPAQRGGTGAVQGQHERAHRERVAQLGRHGLGSELLRVLSSSL